MRVKVLVGVFIFFVFATSAHAQNFSSTNYTVEQPVIVPGGYSTSTSFGLQSILTQLGIGTSTSSSFGTNTGFSFFPLVSTPSVSAIAGDGQVALSWSASEGFLGWSVSGYDVGQSTALDGPYSYSSLGNVTSSTRTGLSNGTTYYFVILPKDTFGNRIATSTHISSTPASTSGGSGGSGGGGGGGGGGGSIVSSGSTVNFSGRAYPTRTITLLKDAQVVGSTIAGLDARFSMSISGISAGNYIFSLYSEDKDGNRSSLLTFPVGLTGSSVTDVVGIFLAPTIATDKEQVKQGDNIAIFGQSQPQANITITVNSSHEIYAQTQSDGNGVYLYTLDSQQLEMGDHSAKSKSALNTEISAFSSATMFTVGDENILAKKKTLAPKGDMNGDNKVNLVDFSIVAYWYRRANSPAKNDINGDGRVDLKDLSIMAFNWTG